MSQLKPLPIFKRGQMLKAADLMELRKRILRQRLTTGQNSGVILTESENGTVIAVTQSSTGFLALAVAPGITARVGTTPGTGQVSLQVYNPTTNIIVNTGIIIDPVKNFSAATGIAAGKYCWVDTDQTGTNWVVSAEC